MPGKMLVLNVIGVVLQYTLIFLLYFFLYKIIRLVYRDLQEPVAVRAYTSEMLEPAQALGRLMVLDSGPLEMDRRVYELGDTVSIGRSEENDIVVADHFVSHEHACISRYKRGYWLADLNSTNHTLLNGRELKEETQLKNGDVIKIGAVTFRFEG